MAAAQDITVKSAEAARSIPERAEEFYRLQASGEDPNKIKTASEKFYASVNAAKPSEIDQATWNSMPISDRMDMVMRGAEAKQTLGINQGETQRTKAENAQNRMPLLQDIRDLAIGKGLPEAEVNGKKLSGVEQMNQMLGVFSGGNVLDMIGRAADQGKFGDFLSDLSANVSRLGMPQSAIDHFQKLVKSLAENQVAMRSLSTNPTDQFSYLQSLSSPSVGNSQKALVSLIDLIAHSERNQVQKYQFMKEKNIPYGMLEFNPEYNNFQNNYIKEHSDIATRDPFQETPSQYTASGTQGGSAPPAKASPAASPKTDTSSNTRTLGGVTYKRQGNAWVKQN